jgi:hypothetical protein
MKTDNQEITYLKTCDLEDRGWTKGMIKKLMPKPCKTRSNRPHYGTTNLYSEIRVLEIEREKSFEELKRKSADRSTKALALAEGRRSKRIESIEEIEIQIEKIDDEILLQLSIDNYNDLQWGKGSGLSESASASSDPEFLERIQVNFIRHELTKYDYLLAAQSRKIGANESKSIIREKILVKIGEVYPRLKDEANRQLRRKEWLS